MNPPKTLNRPALATDQPLVGKTAVVTGAAQGIGFGIAQTLAKAGASVVLADRNDDAAAAATALLIAQGLDAAHFAVDVTDSAQVQKLIDFSEDLRGGISILVNNAGISTVQTIEDTDEAAWRAVIDVNLTGTFLVSKAVLPHLRRRGHGKIVNVASVGGKRISFNAGASYTASKAGIIAFTRHLAYEAAAFGVNVNAICPGPVESPMLQRNASQEIRIARAKSVPAGRLTTPQHQADAVLFLCSSQADMIHGVALDVDGGALLGWYDTETYFNRREATHRPAIHNFPQENNQ